MVIHVTGERLTIEGNATQMLTEAGRAALQALGDRPAPPAPVRGDLPACASLSTAWQALHDSLHSIQRRAALPAEAPGTSGKPDEPLAGTTSGPAAKRRPEPATRPRPVRPRPGRIGWLDGGDRH